MLKDLKYLAAYLLPATAYLSVYLGSWWTFTTVIFTFGLVPLLESLGPKSSVNLNVSLKTRRSVNLFFDWILYLNIPILYGLILYLFVVLSAGFPSYMELAGMILSVGIVVGSSGINVAHELGHRNTGANHRMAEILLLPALYQHFYIEHNRGHHRYVATSNDPASAPRGRDLYSFWITSIVGGYKSAWRIQLDLLKRRGKSPWSRHNHMLIYQMAQILYLVVIGAVWGLKVMAVALLVGLVGILLLETINYIEHYGLRRKQVGNGQFERVKPIHSWNANFELGRILLYELTRHSDHHYLASKKYQLLDHHDESPELPFGYPASMLMALCPPLWFQIMDPKIPGSSGRPPLQTADGLVQHG